MVVPRRPSQDSQGLSANHRLLLGQDLEHPQHLYQLMASGQKLHLALAQSERQLEKKTSQDILTQRSVDN